MKALKNRKASVINRVTAEILKADGKTTTAILQDLFSEIWRQEIISENWSKGLIVKLSKKAKK